MAATPTALQLPDAASRIVRAVKARFPGGWARVTEHLGICATFPAKWAAEDPKQRRVMAVEVLAPAAEALREAFPGREEDIARSLVGDVLAACGVRPVALAVASGGSLVAAIGDVLAVHGRVTDDGSAGGRTVAPEEWAELGPKLDALRRMIDALEAERPPDGQEPLAFGRGGR